MIGLSLSWFSHRGGHAISTGSRQQGDEGGHSITYAKTEWAISPHRWILAFSSLNLMFIISANTSEQQDWTRVFWFITKKNSAIEKLNGKGVLNCPYQAGISRSYAEPRLLLFVPWVLSPEIWGLKIIFKSFFNKNCTYLRCTMQYLIYIYIVQWLPQPIYITYHFLTELPLCVENTWSLLF